MKTLDNLSKALFLVVCSFLITSCDGEDEMVITAGDLPDQAWNILLDGENFNVSNQWVNGYYDSLSGDFVAVGTKSVSTDERIAFTFSLDNGVPFQNGGVIDLGSSTPHTGYYFDGRGNGYTTEDLMGEGTFTVNEYIETDTRNYLSGSVNATLFNPEDSTQVVVTGSFAVKTF